MEQSFYNEIWPTCLQFLSGSTAFGLRQTLQQAHKESLRIWPVPASLAGWPVLFIHTPYTPATLIFNPRVIPPAHPSPHFHIFTCDFLCRACASLPFPTGGPWLIGSQLPPCSNLWGDLWHAMALWHIMERTWLQRGPPHTHKFQTSSCEGNLDRNLGQNRVSILEN